MVEGGKCKKLKVVIELHFCRLRDPDKCSKLPITYDNFAIEVYELDLADFYDVEELVNYILDDLESKYAKRSARSGKARVWRDKMYPFVFETISEVLSDFVNSLVNRIDFCLEGSGESSSDWIFSSTYPSMHSELLVSEEYKDCEWIMECYLDILDIVSRYGPLVYGSLEYVMKKLNKCKRRMVNRLRLYLSPHEKVLRRYGLTNYFYEVYYHS